MDNAKQALVKEHSVKSSQDLNIVASFDGAYPKKGKNSHLCFASMICVDSGRVLVYDICNNLCEKCKEINEKLDNKMITDVELGLTIPGTRIPKSRDPGQFYLRD